MSRRLKYFQPTGVVALITAFSSNAAKYTEKGWQIWLTVNKEGHETILRVQDTGIGISPENSSQIFELFSQLEGALDRSQDGLVSG